MQMLTSKCSQAIAELVDLFKRRRSVLFQEEPPPHNSNRALERALELRNR